MDNAGQKAQEEQDRLESTPGIETVLLVEDDDAVRALARRVLRRNGYTVLEAVRADEALMLCEGYSGAIDLIVTDVVMPGGMNGREMAECLLASRKDHPQVLYMSGYTDDVVVRHGVLDPGLNFLQKPFTPTALTNKVREVLDGS